MPLARDPNRRTCASGMAAAIPEAIALMRGSIVITDALEGVAVMGHSGQEASEATCSSAAAYQSTGLCCLGRDKPLAGPPICPTLPLSGRQGVWGG